MLLYTQEKEREVKVMTINYAHKWNINGKVHYWTSVNGKGCIMREDGEVIFTGNAEQCFTHAAYLIKTSHHGGTILTGRERISQE